MKKTIFLLPFFAVVLLGCHRGTESQLPPVVSTGDRVNYDSLSSELETIYDLDQGYREQVANMKQFDAELVNKMNETDSTNHVRVVDLLETYGWLPRSEIGEKASAAIFYVLQHGSVEIMEKYLDQLQQLATANEADKTHAALMEDRVLMYRGKKQIYGAQASVRQGTDGTREYYVWPIKQPETVNERRRAMGFDLTVEENAARLNAVYNPDDKLPTN